jgi:hypothetical protein
MHPIYFKDNIEDRYQVGQSKRVDVENVYYGLS